MSIVKDPLEFNRMFIISPSDQTNRSDIKSLSGLEPLIMAHIKARYSMSMKREPANGFYPLTNSGNGSKLRETCYSV